MSKADNLKDFLTDVADAIRAKKGSTDLINPQDFSSEIASLSGGLEIVDMTETTATIEPNKVYVWGMVESLDITLAASTGEDDFFAFRFRCSKPTMTTVTVNGATWAADTELNESGNPVLDLGSYYQCEIKGGTSALYARLMHYIPFEDSNVEAVLMSNGLGDGIGITYADAVKVTSFNGNFSQNTGIESFEEAKYFTGVKILNDKEFLGCSSLLKITLPESIEKINAYVFQNCTSLEKINIPKTIKLIGNFAFENVPAEFVINLPNATTINKYIFQRSGCVAVQNLGQLSLFNDGVFRYCAKLRYAILPASFTTAYAYLFNGCSALEAVVCKAVTPPTIGTGCFYLSNDCPVYVPDESVESYKTATKWSDIATRIKAISDFPVDNPELYYEIKNYL